MTRPLLVASPSRKPSAAAAPAHDNARHEKRGQVGLRARQQNALVPLYDTVGQSEDDVTDWRSLYAQSQEALAEERRQWRVRMQQLEAELQGYRYVGSRPPSAAATAAYLSGAPSSATRGGAAGSLQRPLEPAVLSARLQRGSGAPSPRVSPSGLRPRRDAPTLVSLANSPRTPPGGGPSAVDRRLYTMHDDSNKARRPSLLAPIANRPAPATLDPRRMGGHTPSPLGDGAKASPPHGDGAKLPPSALADPTKRGHSPPAQDKRVTITSPEFRRRDGEARRPSVVPAPEKGKQRAVPGFNPARRATLSHILDN